MHGIVDDVLCLIFRSQGDYYLCIRHRCVYVQFLIHRPEHKVLESKESVGVLVSCIDQLIFAVSKLSLHLDDIGISLLSEFLLLLCESQRILSCLNLRFKDLSKLLEIYDVIICFHCCQTDLVACQLLLIDSHLQCSLADLHVIHRRESVKKGDACSDLIAVVERGSRHIGIGLRVHRTTEVRIRISAG